MIPDENQTMGIHKTDSHELDSALTCTRLGVGCRVLSHHVGDHQVQLLLQQPYQLVERGVHTLAQYSLQGFASIISSRMKFDKHGVIQQYMLSEGYHRSLTLFGWRL